MENIEDYKTRVEELKLKLYQGTSTDDGILIQWWNDLLILNELPQVAPSEYMQPPYSFISMFRSPCIFLYTLDDDLVLNFAMWATPLFNGAAVGLWIGPTERQSPSSLKKVRLCLDMFLKDFPVLACYTSEEKITKLWEKVGFVVLGTIPSLMDPQCYVGYITRNLRRI